MAQTIEGIYQKIDTHKAAVEKDVEQALTDLGIIGGANTISTNVDTFPTWTPALLEDMAKIRNTWSTIYNQTYIDNPVNIGERDNYAWDSFFDNTYTGLILSDAPTLNTNIESTFPPDLLKDINSEAAELNDTLKSLLAKFTFTNIPTDEDTWKKQYFNDPTSTSYIKIIYNMLSADAWLPRLNELYADSMQYLDYKYNELGIYEELRKVERNVGGRGFYRPNNIVSYNHLQILTKFEKELEDVNIKLMNKQMETLSGYINEINSSLIETEKYNMDFNYRVTGVLDSVLALYRQFIDYTTLWDIDTFKKKNQYLIKSQASLARYNLFLLDIANKIAVADFKNEMDAFLTTVDNINNKLKAEASAIYKSVEATKKKNLEALDVLSKKVSAINQAYTNRINFDKSQIAARLEGFSSVAKEYIGYSNIGGQGIVGTSTQEPG